jgi:hypothetical protein
MCLRAHLGGVADHLVQDRHEHVEPLDREARLAGERAVQEALERLDLREPVEQRDRIDGIGRRAETPALGRVPKPLPLLGHEDVRVVVADGRAVDAPEGVDDVQHVGRVGACRRLDEAGRQAAQILLGHAVGRGQQRRIPLRAAAERVELRGEMSVATDRLRQVDGADDLLKRQPFDRAADSSAGAHCSNSARVSASTEAGSWRYLSYSSST